MPRSVLLRGPQRLAQVGGDVVGILEAYREADHVLADAGRLKLLRGHLLVRGAGRMDHQRLGVADVGEMRGEAAGLDEFRPCLATALHAEGNDGRSEEHTSELQSLMRISYAVFCLKNTTYTRSERRS